MDPKKFNPNEWIVPIMTLGTWLFVIYQATQGIHWIPDEWILGIILAPVVPPLYLSVRDRVVEAIKAIPKKD